GDEPEADEEAEEWLEGQPERGDRAVVEEAVAPVGDAERHAEEGDGQQVDGAPAHQRTGGADGAGADVVRRLGGGHVGASPVSMNPQGGFPPPMTAAPGASASTRALETRLPTP